MTTTKMHLMAKLPANAGADLRVVENAEVVVEQPALPVTAAVKQTVAAAKNEIRARMASPALIIIPIEPAEAAVAVVVAAVAVRNVIMISEALSVLRAAPAISSVRISSHSEHFRVVVNIIIVTMLQAAPGMHIKLINSASSHLSLSRLVRDRADVSRIVTTWATIRVACGVLINVSTFLFPPGFFAQFIDVFGVSL